MEDPIQQKKTKTLKIKTIHCLLNRLSSKDNSLKINDMGGGNLTSENPADKTKPYIDLALQLNIHEEVGDVFAFEGDEEEPRKRLRTKVQNGLLQVAGGKMTPMELTPCSLLVVLPQVKTAAWLTIPENSTSLVVENKAENWQWAKIADCACENLI